MDIIPAIDIIDGKCVRLSKGDFDKKIIYNDEPLIVAKQFEDAGISRLHLVDLDGAKKGVIQNLHVLESIALNTNLIIDFGGGIKTSQDLQNAFNAGAAIATVGSIAARQPALIEEWILEYGPSKILIGADVLDNKIKINGWQADTGIDIFAFINSMLAVGVTDIFCTDISKDGMMQGVSSDLYINILEKHPNLNLIASGGVSVLQDVVKLKEIGCSGAIIGKAIYEGSIPLMDLTKLNLKK